MDYRMDFLSSREKDPLYAKYSTYPGWHSSHTYEHSPSTATYLQYLSDYGEPNTRVALGARNNLDNKQTETSSTTRVPSQSKLSHRELYDYIDGVRNLVPGEKQRSDSRSYKERDIYAHWEGWESTWQANRRGKAEHVGTNSHQELQAYVNRYHHTLPKKTPGFEVGDWRSSRCSSDIEKLLGCGQWDAAKTSERLQQTSVSSHKRDHSERDIEHWRKWSPWDSRNMESLFPVESFRQPPSYTAPPAYSSPKDGYKLAGIPKVSAQAFPEQTFENRNGNFTETRRNASANNGRCSQNNNQTQNTESYYSDITGGQKQTYSVMQYTAIKTKPSPHTKLQYPESTQITYPDSTQMKQTKTLRRKGGETVFCLVSRMGEVSGLSSSPEEPLKSHVLPLFKPNDKTIATKQTNSPQCRQNQDEYLKRDEAERQLNGCFMFRGHGNTVLGHTGEDQQSNSIRDLSNVENPDKNKQDLQWNDSQSDCLTQKSSMQTDRHEKPSREIIEKFPLWKEPKYSTSMKEERNGQPQEIINESKVTNIEDNNNSTNDQQQSLVIIDATCVVVKVELVHLPEKEHVQYVCLTEEGASSSMSENDEQKQESSVLSTQGCPENNTVDKRAEGILGRADEHHRTVKGVPEEPDRSWDGHVVGPTKEFDESPVEAGEVLEHELMLGQPGTGTTSENNDSLEEIIKAEDQTTAKPEAVLEDLVLTNAEPTLEYFKETTETTIIQIKGVKEQENRPILDDSDCVNPETEQDDNINQKDTQRDLAKSRTEDETDGQREPVLENSTPLIRKSTENARNFILPSTLGNGTLRRSSSSPHLSINSSVLDTSHSDDELWLLSSSTNTEDSQCSGCPSVQSSSTNSIPSLPSTPIPDVLHNSSLPQTRSEPDDVLLCTSLPSEHNLKIQHAKSLRDAVSRIRKHTAPDSETEDEEVDECGDQTEGVSGVYKHTGPDSETEEEVGECGDRTQGISCISCEHTAPDCETEEKEMNEFDDQTEEVNCIHKHTAPDSETEEEVGECGDQIAGVNCISKHTVLDLEIEEEEVNEAVNQTEEVNCVCKHTAPDSETEDDEVGVPDEQTEGISCIHKHTFHSETEDEKVHKSGDQTEVNCKHTAPDSETEEEMVGEFDEQTEGMSRIHKHTAFHYEEQTLNESGDQTEGVHHLCKHTALVSEEEEVNESGDQTEEVNCTCKHSDSYSEEEEVNESNEKAKGISRIHKLTAFHSEEQKVNESGDQTESICHICKHTAPVSEEEEVNESVDQTEEVNCIHKHTDPEFETEEEEVEECGDRPEGESTDSLYQSLNKEQE